MDNFFWKAWAVVFVLAIFWLGWCLKTSAPAAAQSGEVPEVIRAERFEVVDWKGRRRAIIGIGEDMGSPGMWLNDEEGVSRAEFFIYPDGSPSLLFWDAEDKVRAGFGLDYDGRPMLKMSDVNGELRAELVLDSEGSPALSLNDANGSVLFSAP